MNPVDATHADPDEAGPGTSSTLETLAGSSVEQTIAAPDAIAPPASVEMVVAEGDKLGRYVVLSRIGAGMMGVVYAAFDPQLDRKVAVKVMNPALLGGAGKARTQKQLIREARTLARIAHPNVVAVYDVGTVHDRVFVAMEFVEGQTLDAWIQAEERPWDEVLAKMLDAGHGLAAAHEQGVVHCDFKPANVLAGTDGRVRVMDFGLARASRRAAFDELANQKLRVSTVDQGPGGPQGTPAYMAPEQHSLPGDARSDQFSFCVATWEALYGQRPFAGDTPATLLRAALDQEVQEPPAGSRVPAWVRTALTRGLSPFPDRRFESMAALLRALHADPRRRRPWLLAGAALAVLGLGAGGLWAAMRAKAERTCNEHAEQLGAVWTDDARASLQSSLGEATQRYATSTVERLLPILDTYAEQLHAGGLATCRAAKVDGILPDELYARAEACFMERRSALEGVVDGLAPHNSGSLRDAINVAATLPSVPPCGDRAWLESDVALLPDDPATRARAIELRAKLASLVSFRAAADFRGGRQQIQQVLTEAESLGSKPLIAQVLLQLAFYSYTSGDAKAAEQAYARAFEVATAADRDDLAAVAAASAAQLLAARLGRLEEAQVWARLARAQTESSSLQEGSWRGDVANGLGAVAVRAENWPACSREFDRARTIFTEIYGPEHPQVARAMVNVSTCLVESERWEEGLELQREAITTLEQALGTDHPLVGVSVLNRSLVLKQHGHYDQAQEAADRAHAILTEAYAPDTVEARAARAQRASLLHFRGHFEQALAEIDALTAKGNTQQGSFRAGRATLLANLGRLEEAQMEAERAIEERIDALGQDHPSLSPMYGALAEVLLFRGDAAGALVKARRAMELQPTGLERAHVLRQLAGAQLELGALIQAKDAANQALNAMALHPAGDPFVAQARFLLARATQPEDLNQARALAQQALASLREVGGGFDRHADEVQAWLDGLDRTEDPSKAAG